MSQPNNFCAGYATGLRDGLTIGVFGGDECWPNSLAAMNGTQVHDVIANYVRAHPEQRHLPILSIVVAALREAWPCEGGAP